MRLPLHTRVLLLVFLINVALFAAGGLFVFQAQVRLSERQRDQSVEEILQTLQVRGDANVRYILKWPGWSEILDARLRDRTFIDNPERKGVDLNPVGSSARSPNFGEVEVVEAIREAIETGRTFPGPSEVWGALWYRADSRVDVRDLLGDLLGWFVVSTILLTAGTYFALRRLVLDPVERLAEAARRVRAGDLSVQVVEPPRHDEVAELVRSFNAMTTTLRDFNLRLELEVRDATEKARRAEAAAMTQRRLAAMGELAAGIAHEINNPLGGLQNAVDRLQTGDLSEAKREEYVRLLGNGLERIGRTVSQLLRFTPREMTQAPVDLSDVARDAIDLVRHRADRLGVALELGPLEDDGVGPTVVEGARNELGQAILNLLANSLDAIEEHGSEDPRGPRIRVGVGRRSTAPAPEEGDRSLGVVVEVRDNGPGVGAEELARVSDLFYTTKDVGKGSGLGLALVHNTVHSHGGRVTVSSVRGSGFTVELWFPTGGGGDPAGGGGGTAAELPPASEPRREPQGETEP
ncbi:MAG: HAMP domain-containing sensor histidine kinase [Planctomycetota bacterium]|nr:HAMP domain-containing sensor histidine kinase [Planctomycetota bacterium]